MRLGQSYKQHGIPQPPGGWDAIVIGSGLGGLACASMLARHAGQRVLVLERHYTAGGFTHVFQRPGYEWDVGVHYVGDVHRPGAFLRRAFDHLTDGELAWEELGEVYDQIIIGDDAYDFVRGREAFRARMHDYFPSQRDAIDGYIDEVRSAVRASKRFFLEKTLPPTVSRFVGGFLRRSAEPHARATLHDVLTRLTPDARLRGVLAGQWGDYGLPPQKASFFMHALLVGHYFNGGSYPVGGSSRIAATILPGIERAGGAVITSAEVERVIVDRGRAVGVRLVGGEEIRGRRVISDAGRTITFGRFLTPEESLAAGQPPALPDVAPSFGHLSLYIGLKKTASELNLHRANQWVYPHHDHDRNVARYIANPDEPLPVAYLSFPSAKDPDFERRHPGRATIDVVGLVPWQWFQKWDGSPWKKRGQDYEDFKARLSERLMAALVSRCPQIVGHVDHAELSTPLSTKHFSGHPTGELYGLSHSPARFAARGLRAHTGVKGLHLTGADVCTAGVGGALMGGLLTATVVGKRNMIGELMKS